MAPSKIFCLFYFNEAAPSVSKGKNKRIILPDGQADEAMFSAKVGTWLKNAMSALLSRAFWVTMLIAHSSRGPLDHFQRWMQSAPKPRDKPKVVQIVCGKASKFEREWAAMLGGAPCMWDPVLDVGDFGGDPLEWVSASVHSCTSLLCDFHRRVSRVCGELPMKLMWFVFADHDRDCPHRRSVARDLLYAAGSLLDTQVVKFRALFLVEVSDCVSTRTTHKA